MPKSGFGYSRYNQAPGPMPVIPPQRQGTKATAQGLSQESRARMAANTAPRSGPNMTAGQVQKMPIGTAPMVAGSMKASGIPSGMKQGVPPGISSRMRSEMRTGMAPGTAAEPAPGYVTKAAQKSAAGSRMTGPVLDFSPGGLLNGIILSEVLGKPKCLQKTFGKRW
jgi:hypothetical protein